MNFHLPAALPLKCRRAFALALLGSFCLLGETGLAQGRAQEEFPRPAKRGKNTEPLLTFLVPGFQAKRLPLDLTNLVNLQYRHDGVLVCLGYNGNIWLARDTDADGLEDSAKLFWEGRGQVSAPIGMDLAPAGSPHGNAVFFACKGAIMMVTDKNGDDSAHGPDEVRVLASGWEPAHAGIDAASVCFDGKNGSLYYGLGVRLYNNAYELDDKGVAGNDLTSDRGAILRLSPDFKTREKLCTGLRWPVGLRFNEKGDLFCSDQEGATWLPNGNPLDELLHIQRDRHYGFPPRHPKHLPHVVDEPSVFDYGPQHQSTCGMRFNLPNAAGISFGPASWRNDLLVTGESRGKLYRTKLVKTPDGYVARNQTFACMNTLAVDVTMHPKGDSFLLAAHSGEPDWGSGPEGKGHIWRVTYEAAVTAPECVRAVLQPNNALRLDFASDLPTSDAVLPQPQAVEYWRGEYVMPGDRFETMWPGYEVIKRQRESEVTRATVHAVKRLSTRSLALSFTYPAERGFEPGSIRFTLAGHSYEVAVETHGVATETEVLPHPSMEVTRAFVGEEMTEKAGKHTKLTARLDLRNLLHPKLQPGTQLDWLPEPEKVKIVLTSPGTRFSGKIAGKAFEATQGHIAWDASVELDNHAVPFALLEVDFKDASLAESGFAMTWSTQRDPRPRAFPLHRFMLPWLPVPLVAHNALANAERPELKGGNWEAGKQIFHGTTAQCGSCHKAHGEGRQLGPDLANLITRDYQSVWKDIQDPSATINPDYITHEFTFQDGKTLQAVRRAATEPGKVLLGLGAGAEIVMEATNIKSATPLKHSLMPAGLIDQLSETERRDLMTFLLTVGK